MRIVVAGGSGFLGSALTTRLEARGDRVQILTRTPSAPNHLVWNPSELRGAWTDAVASADAVVNLAGERLDTERWTPARKALLVESRVAATRALVTVLNTRGGRAVLLNASAVGYYGARGAEAVTENDPAGHDFLATLCQAWEAEALEASSRGRVVRLRTGLVLDPHAGALKPLLLPFRLGVGGPFGSGDQFWSWIHRDDWVRLALLALDDGRVDGAINLTAPNPVTNRAFARTLGRVLHRPAILPAPAFALRLLLGEMADAMALSGQRALPAVAEVLGFPFEHRDLSTALHALLDS